LDSPAHARWLEHHTDLLLAFGLPAATAPAGFAWLDNEGKPDPSRPLELWIAGRMTHIYCLGAALGRPGCAELADHGLSALTRWFADENHGGWHSSVTWNGEPRAGRKEAYAHAFVVLAAASATAIGRPGAKALLNEGLEVFQTHFLDADSGLVVDGWDTTFTDLDPYRGANANMHWVEALLAAADATGQSVWRNRALTILSELINVQARAAAWRVPEHYDSSWRQIPEYNQDKPNDQFRPFGVTPGHGLEWSRLVLEARAALGGAAPAWMLEAAQGLFSRAVDDGWAADGEPGFCYTTDFDGRPVVRHRLHWVAAEAIGAAATAYRATGQKEYAKWYERWWDYVARYVIDRRHGSWHHELDDAGHVSADMWDGKPDIYHAVQATLIPRLPLAPSLAAALAGGLLDAQ
jgi:mannose/cellobiose epimerase-like protein (N-acyl-D-glucosamine 2-epimerase family)